VQPVTACAVCLGRQWFAHTSFLDACVLCLVNGCSYKFLAGGHLTHTSNKSSYTFLHACSIKACSLLRCMIDQCGHSKLEIGRFPVLKVIRRPGK